jgi:hypothetical protein
MTKHFSFNLKTLILILLLLILYSCNCYQTHLTNEDKTWTAGYQKGQIMIFKSNLGNLDTIQVKERIEDFTNPDCNRLEIGSQQRQYISIELKPNKCHNIYYCNCTIWLEKEDDKQEVSPSIRTFGLEFSTSNQLYRLISEKLILSTSNKKYNAYYFADKLNAINYGNNYLKSFYWDKKDGLIRYESYDGEIFELLKIIK